MSLIAVALISYCCPFPSDFTIVPITSTAAPIMTITMIIGMREYEYDDGDEYDDRYHEYEYDDDGYD